MKSLFINSLFSLIFFAGTANAYPDLMQPVGTSGLPLKVFKDHDRSDLFWYIPISVEPWTRDSTYRSALFKDENNRALSFVFRGQPSVEESMIREVAKGQKVPVANFTPIFLEYSKDFTCQNIYAGDPNVTWLFPNQIGNYLEMVPVSIRVKNDPELVKEVFNLINGGGLACTVSVGFKAYSMAYKAHYNFDLNQVYSRFESSAHAEGFWWEIDLHTVLQSMRQEGAFDFHLDEDTTIPTSVLDQKMAAAFEDLERNVITLLFTPAMKLPNGSLPDRGKAFSLRADYIRSEQNSHFLLKLSSDKVTVKNSQIGIRLGVK
jgi:hypothetical protein